MTIRNWSPIFIYEVRTGQD